MRRLSGFTLIELLAVLAIIAVLLTLALPRYVSGLDMSKQRVLVENLRVTRDAIDKYYTDHSHYPDSLDELVQRRYLKSLPYDPIVESDQQWSIVAPEPPAVGGVQDLHSTATGKGPDGHEYATF